ncbi:MAG: 16S rRNA (guanine(527)-N(7))-methyltransferase RsmG [Betaproteobacteria bacterium]|nr:16S rRNA (guanine(527)-N(7))-methyltransferase RsmG [Betaproteobacteria bacterium]
MNLAEQFSKALDQMGLAIDAATQARLLDYLALLAKWNKTYNLTAIHEPERMLTHHLLDSLALLPHVGGERLLDVGSGGGLPGIPLAIARPGLQVTVLDSNHKKAAFMQQAVIELRLANVEVVCDRSEAYSPAAAYSQIVCRAFSDLSDFVRATRHALAPGGEWLAMKGVYPNEEIAQLKGARLKRDVVLHVPGLEAERHLIVLQAEEETA